MPQVQRLGHFFMLAAPAHAGASPIITLYARRRAKSSQIFSILENFLAFEAKNGKKRAIFSVCGK